MYKFVNTFFYNLIWKLFKNGKTHQVSEEKKVAKKLVLLFYIFISIIIFNKTVCDDNITNKNGNDKKYFFA
jgi:hypothetical protein